MKVFFSSVLLINALRPDRTLAVTKKFVFNLLSEDTLKTSESVLDFTNIIDKEVNNFLYYFKFFYMPHNKEKT
jgi:hypothetical protein